MKNKIVFITGASSGIGKAAAEQFARLGAKLILCARRYEKLETLSQALKQQYNTSTKLIELDVCCRTAVASAIDSLTDEWQAIDVLVNNAGLAAGLDKIQDANIDDWEAMIDTNVKGLLYVSRAIIPLMIKRNQGHIINIGSTAGYETYTAGSVYCGTKHAVTAITRGIKLDLTGYNIRVTSISPGMVETEFSHVRFKGEKERAAKVYAGMTPLTPLDIANAIVYAANCPPHVNISEMIIMPTAQSSCTVVARTPQET